VRAHVRRTLRALRPQITDAPNPTIIQTLRVGRILVQRFPLLGLFLSLCVAVLEGTSLIRRVCHERHKAPTLPWTESYPINDVFGLSSGLATNGGTERDDCNISLLASVILGHRTLNLAPDNQASPCRNCHAWRSKVLRKNYFEIRTVVRRCRTSGHKRRPTGASNFGGKVGNNLRGLGNHNQRRSSRALL
jgi:hypothetical protein